MSLMTKLKVWAPTLSIWGASAGIGILYFGEGIPLVNNDILSKIPILGKRYPVEQAE